MAFLRPTSNDVPAWEMHSCRRLPSSASTRPDAAEHTASWLCAWHAHPTSYFSFQGHMPFQKTHLTSLKICMSMSKRHTAY